MSLGGELTNCPCVPHLGRFVQGLPCVTSFFSRSASYEVKYVHSCKLQGELHMCSMLSAMWLASVLRACN